MSIFSINITLTNLRTYPHSFWFSMKVKMIMTIGTPVAIIIILFLSISLSCRCFQNGKSCAHKNTRPTSLQANNSHIELESISAPLPNTSTQLSRQIIQEILKASGVDFSKFECYICCKAKCHTTTQGTKI